MPRRTGQGTRPTDAQEANDAHLLNVFAATGSAEAFEELLRRHGPMVRGVCRRVAGNEADADDAFQATFLVLARKGGSLSRPQALPSWLYGVALRTARKARAAACSRRRREQAAAERKPKPTSTGDVWLLLDEEISRLPEKYRQPVVLHYLQSHSIEELARRLGCTEGAVKMRLLRARDLLRGRLGRRGVVLTAAVLPTLLSQQEASALPDSLIGSTLQTAKLFAARSATATASAVPVGLARGVIQDMRSMKIRIGVVAVLVVSALAGGAWLVLGRAEPPEWGPSAAGRKAAELTPPADRAAVVQGGNAFALDLYGRLRERDGNLFFSPASVSTALAMMYGGARGKTAQEMAQALHFTLPNERLHPAFAGLIWQWNGGGKKRGYQLRVANALWGRTGLPLQKEFLALNRGSYGAELTPLDFGKEPEAARQTINTWVEKHTENKIKDLLRKGFITPNTFLVLTNAIYFKGDWRQKFDRRQTLAGEFHLEGGKTVQARLMQRTDTFRYHDFGDYKAIDLPYVEKDLSLLILLPARKDGRKKLEEALSAAVVEKCVAALSPVKDVQLTLPRFQLTEEYDLVPPLKALGMRKAFEDADFSGISVASGLAITAIVHKAVIDVHEEGAEAAAATGVKMAVSAPENPPVFRADHPFVFLIRDNRSGAILFVGRVMNPAK